MRYAAGAGLLALVGCNQVFGINATREFDASTDVLPDLPYVRLTWQIAQVSSSGGPDPEILDAPIQPAPRVRHAALTDAAFTDTEYSPADGLILVRREYFDPGTTWRLEYTLADGVPHEVQWSPEDKRGHLTIPLFGRRERDPAPVQSGYKVTPSGATSFTFPRMFTTGLWTEGLSPLFTGTTVDYDFANAISLSGPKGRPDPTRGDRAVLVDYQTNGDKCRFAVGSAALASAALEAGKQSTPAATWDAATKSVTANPVAVEDLDRLTNRLGWMSPKLTGTVTLGIAPAGNMPGLPARASSALSGASLPVPVMLTLLECPYTVTALPKVAQPAILDPFPRVLHVQLVATRQVNGVSLASGMEAAALAPTSTSFMLSFPAAVPTQLILATPAAGDVNLAGATEGVDAGPASGSFTLRFTPETGAAIGADYYEVTLHRLVGTTLATERVYTVTSPRVQIDGALLAPGAEYVFQVRSFSGHPSARQGDFRPVAYPYGSAIVFSRTFKTR